jgi:hypothetical protein
VPGSGWGQSSLEQQSRRSIYIHVKRSLLVPMLSGFDFPEPDTTCEARFITTQPGQALGMLNGDFLNQQAAFFAERLSQDAGNSPESQIATALKLTMSREATPEEIQRGLALISRLKERHQMNDQQALTWYCLFVLNLNEFLYVD